MKRREFLGLGAAASALAPQLYGAGARKLRLAATTQAASAAAFGMRSPMLRVLTVPFEATLK